MFQIKKFVMKLTPAFLTIAIGLIFFSCENNPNKLSVINSESFHESQIQVFFEPENQFAVSDSLDNYSTKESHTIAQNNALNRLDEMLSVTENMRKSGSDSIWISLLQTWNDFNAIIASQTNSSTHKMFPEAIQKWVELNIALVKFSGEARFGDAIEKIMSEPEIMFIPEKLLKSAFYTHVDDKIFINLIGSSSIEYQHTTGGNVKFIQETSYPEGDVMILKSECNDTRFVEIFIRIPSWAVNPTVTYGNVKYVARPGEYTQISRKWKTGDEISVDLKN